jgi:small subunit ribosomal protein S3e
MSLARRSRLSTKRKFVADGVFYSELNELLTRELAEDGYAGVEVRTTPHRTEIIIRATRTQNVLGEKGQRIRELTSVVQKRFDFADGAVELYAERVQNRGLCAQAQAESLKFKLLGGLAVRRACYGVVRFVMEASAKGCEVIVSGKLRGQRAKAMKFGDGYMIKTGHAGQVYTDVAVRHVMMRQGVVGIKVQIMLPHDPKGVVGPKIPLDDVVVILEPKEEMDPAVMLARQQAAAAAAALAAAQVPVMGAPMDEDIIVDAEDPNVAAGF